MAASETSLGVCDFTKDGKPVTFGTWVWSRKEIERPDSVLQFLTLNGVNEIYLVYDPQTAIEKYRQFVVKSTADNVRVSLIGADANWVLPRGYAKRNDFFAFYENYQASAAPNEKLYGMHMDIEPHQLIEWQQDNPGTVKAYCDFVMLARVVAGRTISLLELDIPCWFDNFVCKDTNDESINLIEFCIRHADTTLFMSYRDSGRGAVDFARTGLAMSEKYSKKISLGFETGHIYEESNITFDHLGTVPLCRELCNLRHILKTEYNVPAVGYAVHHYNSWVVLPLYGNLKGKDFPYDNPNYAYLLKNS